jgi:hypothetical protein
MEGNRSWNGRSDGRSGGPGSDGAKATERNGPTGNLQQGCSPPALNRQGPSGRSQGSGARERRVVRPGKNGMQEGRRETEPHGREWLK